MNGIFNILKPTGMTSHDVVSRVRRLTKIKKVGHTGTLDPNASGVLPICIGKATKISEYILNKEKSYRAELILGIQTDTLDGFGEIVNTIPVFDICENKIREVFKSFIGEITQIPPIYSAIKVNGRKLYDIARSGECSVEINPRQVNIKSIEIIEINSNRILFDVVCSKGTYIRSLCRDIGMKLGTCAYMSFLLRTASGNFNIEDSITLEDLEEMVNNGKINDYLYGADYALVDYKSIAINDRALSAYVNGNIVYRKGIILNKDYEDGDIVKVYCNKQFYGVGRVFIFEDQLCLKSHKAFI